MDDMIGLASRQTCVTRRWISLKCIMSWTCIEKLMPQNDTGLPQAFY